MTPDEFQQRVASVLGTHFVKFAADAPDYESIVEAAEVAGEMYARAGDRARHFESLYKAATQQVKALRARLARTRAALSILSRLAIYVDNGMCSLCHGYWPDEHRDLISGHPCPAPAIRSLLAEESPR